VRRTKSNKVIEAGNNRAIVRGSATNNDGSAKVGYTAPSVQGQAEVIGAILRWEGVQAIKRVISRNEITQVVISPLDIPSAIAKGMPKETNLVDEIGKATTLRAARSRPDTRVEYAAPRNEIKAMISEIWEKLLGIEKIGVQDDFFTLGGDSVLSIQVISRLREVFPVDMSPAMLFERPTIAELSNALIEQLAQKGDVETLDQFEVDASYN
jgi:acyl carrier protein